MNNPSNLNASSSSILSDLIQRGREHNEELSVEDLEKAFPDHALSQEDMDQIRFILQANGIHLQGSFVPAKGEATAAPPPK